MTVPLRTEDLLRRPARRLDLSGVDFSILPSAPELAFSGPRVASPSRRPWDDLSYEVRAAEALRPELERSGFVLDSVECWADGPTELCAVCSHHPKKRYLGASIVRCTARDCTWERNGDIGEYQRRFGWVPDDCISRRDTE